jgi:hypothetical protein
VVRGRVHLTLAHRGTVELRGARNVARLAAADVDGDGDADLVAATRHGALRVFRNDRKGHLSPVRPRPRSTGLAHSSTGRLSGQSSDDPPSEASRHAKPPAAVARIGAFPVLERAGPGTHHQVALRLTDVAPRSPRAPPLA